MVDAEGGFCGIEGLDAGADCFHGGFVEVHFESFLGVLFSLAGGVSFIFLEDVDTVQVSLWEGLGSRLLRLLACGWDDDVWLCCAVW